MDDGADNHDERLLEHLRELALVDVDTLLIGADDAAVLAAHVDLVEDALVAARARLNSLATEVRRDPLAILDLAAERRVGEGARQLVARAVAGMVARRSACITMIRLDDACQRLLPKLQELHHRL